MPLLPLQSVTRDGLAPSLTAAGETGDSFANSGKEVLYVKNDAEEPRTVAIPIAATLDGQPAEDRQVTIAAGTVQLIGPFPPAVYNDPAGRVHLTYSDEDGLSVAVLKFP